MGYNTAMKVANIFFDGDTKKAFLWSNLISIIFNLIKIIETTPTIMIGRFGFGMCAGIQSLYASKALYETIPSNEQQRYMVWINLSMCFGMLMA